jgi:hypothetical protein
LKTRPNPDHFLSDIGLDETIDTCINNTLDYNDSPAINIGYYTNFIGLNPGWLASFTTATNFNKGDYVYQKRDFIYFLTNSIGSAYAVCYQHVGTITVAQRMNTTGTISIDWSSKSNIATTTIIPDCSGVSKSEIQAIVAPSTSPIIIDPSATNDVPNP